ncbi:MAG TPA: FAD-dependent oxidoreductase [Fimbriiglobus sp.]|jgi:glycine oxidase|nr:FAD-dependent oxidoreductase [Fimbriiglobus sp.]
MATKPDVLVIGGGIIGLTSAYFLAKTGLSVEVIDKGDLGREASWAGAGIIPPGWHPELTSNPFDRLRAASVRRFNTLSAELLEDSGISNEYHQSGGVEFLREDELSMTHRWDAERIFYLRLSDDQSRRTARTFVKPPGVVAFLLPFHQVRNPLHMAALIEACRRRRVVLRPNTPFGWWDRVARAVVPVAADGTRKPAGAYLVCAGAWADEVLGPLGCHLGVRPVRGQIVLFNPERVLFKRILIVGKRYLVPRLDGRVLAGSTEEPEAGFEKANTPEGVRGLIDFAHTLVPGLRAAAVEKTWSGLRPGSPDEMPFIGSVPGCDAVFASVGHFRAGVQLSVGTAEMVRDLVLRQPTEVPAEPFRLDRPPADPVRPTFRS